MPGPPYEAPYSRVVTVESAVDTLFTALPFLAASQIGPLISSIRAEKPLEVPRGYATVKPQIIGGKITNFHFWLDTSDFEFVELLVNGLLGYYSDGIWLGGYVFEVPFLDPTPVLSQKHHTSFDDRFATELKTKWLRQTKKRKSGVWKSRIQVRQDGTVSLPFVDRAVRRVPLR